MSAGTGSPAFTPHGPVRRRDRRRPTEDAWRFIDSADLAHAAVVTPEGWPSVIPWVFVPEAPRYMGLHTTRGTRSAVRQAGAHSGHLRLEFDAMGEATPGACYACESSLGYASVVAFGTGRLRDDPERKTWVFDRLMTRSGRPEWTFAAGYPHASAIALYEVSVDMVTMEQNGQAERP